MAAQATLERRWSELAPAAQYAHISTKTLRRMIAAGELRAYRFGPRLLRVDLNEVDALFRPIPTAGDAA